MGSRFTSKFPHTRGAARARRPIGLRRGLCRTVCKRWPWPLLELPRFDRCSFCQPFLIGGSSPLVYHKRLCKTACYTAPALILARVLFARARAPSYITLAPSRAELDRARSDRASSSSSPRPFNSPSGQNIAAATSSRSDHSSLTRARRRRSSWRHRSRAHFQPAPVPLRSSTKRARLLAPMGRGVCSQDL